MSISERKRIFSFEIGNHEQWASPALENDKKLERNEQGVPKKVYI